MATHRLRYQGRDCAVTVKKTDAGYVVNVDGKAVTITKKGAGYFASDGACVRFGEVALGKSNVFVSLDSRLFEFELSDSDSVSSGSDGGHAGEKDKLRAPMPGKIVKILVECGASVTEKQPLAVIESMKMENQLLSPSAGEVKAIHFGPGEQVDAEDVIVELAVEVERSD